MPAKRPATQVPKKKDPRGAVTPRVLCICVSLPIDRAKVQAEADFKARFDEEMRERGFEEWDWANDPTASAAFDAAVKAIWDGTKTIDELLREVDSVLG